MILAKSYFKKSSATFYLYILIYVVKYIVEVVPDAFIKSKKTCIVANIKRTHARKNTYIYYHATPDDE